MNNMKKKTYIESEIDKFLKDHGDKKIYISYDKDKDSGKYKNKFNTEEITKSLNKLCNNFFDEFHEEYNKFAHNYTELEKYKSETKREFSKNQKKIGKI